MKNDRYVYYKDVKPQDMGGGVIRRVLAYSDDLMVVENTFEKGAVGSLHHHPHTQITYVVSGVFESQDERRGARLRMSGGGCPSRHLQPLQAGFCKRLKSA